MRSFNSFIKTFATIPQLLLISFVIFQLTWVPNEILDFDLVVMQGIDRVMNMKGQWVNWGQLRSIVLSSFLYFFYSNYRDIGHNDRKLNENLNIFFTHPEILIVYDNQSIINICCPVTHFQSQKPFPTQYGHGVILIYTLVSHGDCRFPCVPLLSKNVHFWAWFL